MWRKNLLFLAFCTVIAVATAAGLQTQNRIEQRPPDEPAKWNRQGFDEVLQRLNGEFEATWEAEQLQPAPPADDLTVARRLALGLAGTVPSLEEIRALLDVPKGQRQAWWISRLLADRRSSDYLAERFARAFVGADNGPFFVFRRRRFVNWLSDVVHENQPYDQLVRHLLADDGLWTSNPAVNFVTVTVNDGRPDPVRLAGRTCRAFLGIRIDCLQCHDDHLGTINLGDPGKLRGGMQTDFHELAAFFGRATVSVAGVRDRKGEYKTRYLNAEDEVVVTPSVPFLREALPRDGSPRRQLARWVTDPRNKPFAREAVNRVWALLFGRPLVEPIDDIPLEGPYPAGLEILAEDFIEHGYDLHRLIRLIATSAPFQRDSRADFEITPAHETHWAAFPLTRLRPEQVAGSLLQGCSVSTIDAGAHIVFRLQQYAQTNQFVRRYGDMGEDEFDDRGGTIPQRLLMMNGNLVQEHIRNNPLFNASTQIAMFAADDEEAVDCVFLSVLSRTPTETERARFVDRLRNAKGSQRRQTIEDMFWILINSTEFSWNH